MNTLKLKYLLIIFTSIVLCFNINSCDKSHNYRLNGDLKFTSGVDTGSFFIYRDSITHELDTLLVTQSVLQYYSPNGYSLEEDGYDIESRVVEFSRKNKHLVSVYFELSFIAYSKNNKLIGTLLICDSNSKKYNNNIRLYSEPFVSQQDNMPIGYFATQNIADSTYSNVYVNLYGSSLSENYIETCYSLESGLLKFRFRNGNYYRSMELISALIKRTN